MPLCALCKEPQAQARIIRHMRALGVQRDEATLSLELRGLLRQGRVDEAFELLVQAEDVTPRTRTYTDVLHRLCENRMIERATMLQDLMQRRGLQLDDETLLVSLSVLSSQSADRAAMAHNLQALQACRTALQATSAHAFLSSTPPVGRTASLSPHGTCSACGECLQRLTLAPEDRRLILNELRSAVDATGRAAQADFADFDEFLTRRRGAFSYVIDGANVAYRNQNFPGGRFSFVQVELARTALQARCPRRSEPLLLLPQRYLAAERIPNHAHAAYRTRSSSQESHSSEVTDEDAALVFEWRKRGSLWCVPDDANDDWYWLHAAIRASDVSDESHDERGQPLIRVLTNDEMRDHAFMVSLTPRLRRNFVRWKARHMCRFHFSHGARGHPCSDEPPPSLIMEEPPSRGT